MSQAQVEPLPVDYMHVDYSKQVFPDGAGNAISEASTEADEEALARQVWIDAETERAMEEEQRFHEELLEERRLVEDQARIQQAKKAERLRRLSIAVKQEAFRQADEEEHREKQEALQSFLRHHGFSGPSEPKKSGSSGMFGRSVTTYPLHCAAKLGDAQVLELLLEQGAAPTQRNSSGHTAAEVAQRRNKKGSHKTVLRLLSTCDEEKAGTHAWTCI